MAYDKGMSKGGAAYRSGEMGSKGGSNLGQPFSRGGYPKPFSGANEMGKDELKAAKSEYSRGKGGKKKMQKDAYSTGVGRGSGLDNEMG